MTVKKFSWRFIVAGIVAILADVVQWVLFPFFAVGAVNPVDDILDFVVGGIMVWLLGFHWVFVPAAIGELVPFANMMPFWTGAVFIVGMGKEGMLPAMPTMPGQAGTPAFPTPATAPGQAPLPAPTDAQTANSLNPYFREIERK